VPSSAGLSGSRPEGSLRRIFKRHPPAGEPRAVVRIDFGWLLPAKLEPSYKMLTARETIRPIVTSETIDWAPITLLAMPLSGIVSVGEKAVALVSET
jgi:hypothetical protein